jgi:hypothetical protein
MDFVIVNSEQHSEFDEFKRAMNDPDCVLLSSNTLLDYWNEVYNYFCCVMTPCFFIFGALAIPISPLK